jgi:16S rRNA (cytidine1402-2'-O)-methyltransferase
LPVVKISKQILFHLSTLFIVATPIGNLNDFSQRAVDTLKTVDRIACEDTRTSSVLLNHFQIDKPLFSFHQHNEHKRVHSLIDMLDRGETIALISDAGMPGISDPGFLAARAAHQAGHEVCPLPGPDAATAAVAASGLPCDRFTFEGFLPPKKGRQTRIREISESEITTVVYESPHRLIKFLNALSEFCSADRWICIARELTKRHEEIDRGQLGGILQKWKERESIKGELVVVIAGKDYSE